MTAADRFNCDARVRGLILKARPSLANATDGELNFLWSQLTPTAQADILATGKAAPEKKGKNGKSD
tara:strand:- start:1111 stop:1308 length:198 start_codon:yes stop_codon:yes gene_type:complete